MTYDTYFRKLISMPNYDQSIHSLQGHLKELQEIFRTQFSKIGNAKKQLFHAWKSFHFDENVETIDTYVQRKIQMANVLSYGEQQTLDVLKNTLT